MSQIVPIFQGEMSRFFKVVERSLKSSAVLSNFRSIWCNSGCLLEKEKADCQVDCNCDPVKPKAVAVLRCKCLGIVGIFERFLEQGEFDEELEKLEEDVLDVTEKSDNDSTFWELKTIVYSYDWLFANFRDRCEFRVLSDSKEACDWLELKYPKPRPDYRPFMGKFIRTQAAFGMSATLEPVSRVETMDADLLGRFGRPCFLGVLLSQKALNLISGDIVDYLNSVKAEVYVCGGEYTAGPNFQFRAVDKITTSLLVVFQKALPNICDPAQAQSFPPLVLFDYLLKEAKLTRFLKNVENVTLYAIKRLVVIGGKDVLKVFSFEGGRPFCMLTLRKGCIDYVDKKFLGCDSRTNFRPRVVERRFRIAEEYYAKNFHGEKLCDGNDRVLIFSGRALRESSRPYLPVADYLFVAVVS